MSFIKKLSVLLILVLSVVLISCDTYAEDEAKILEVKNALVVPTETNQDLNLITTYEIDGVVATISWESSNQDVLSNQGVIKQGEEDVVVDLKVTITVNTRSQSFNIFTVTVLKKAASYTITYDLAGGSCDVLINSFTEGETITLPTPTKENHTFLGWYEGDVKVISLSNKNYNLVAKWQSNVSNPTLTIEKDLDEVFIDYEIELYIEGYSNLEDFDITASNPDMVKIDPEGYVACKKAGNITITCTLKEDPTIWGSISFVIKNKIPTLSLKSAYVIAGKEFELKMSSYDDFSLFDIEYDSEYIEYNNGFKALKPGTTVIKVSLKEDPLTCDDIEITIYDPKPQLSIISNNIVLGETSRLDVLNYDTADVVFEPLTEGIVSFDGRLVTALKTGEVTVKVYLANDKNIYSTIDLVVVPIKPVLKLSSENILVGGKSRLTIANINELEYPNLDDYKVEIITSTLIASIDSDWIIDGKSLGKATIKVTAKNNDYISETIEINVIETSTKKDSNGEIAEGPLVLTIDDFNGYIHAGEMLYVKIAGANDLTNYKWVTSDDTVLAVYEDGRIICIKEGPVYVVATNKTNGDVAGRIYINVYGTPNVNYVDRLIKIAESQLGYKEGANNDTKYGDWYGLPNEPWCAMFVSWCAYQAGIGTDVILKYCGCTAGMEWFVKNGRFGYKENYTPKAGDIIFFLSDGASHTGIVINCVGNRVYTIEGNTSNMCAKRSYDLNHSTITGYGIPNYPEFNGEVSGGDIGGSTEGGGNSTT